MIGDFTFYNPTRIYFGKDAIFSLTGEVKKYGKNVMLIYGGGSIKENGIYNQVMDLLSASGKDICEFGGIMSNPTYEKLKDGIKKAKEFKPNLILAVGGGSCCDYAKALGASIYCEDDPWEKYYVKQEQPECEMVPVGCILTMVGTGSEMNPCAVITNTDTNFKIGHDFPEELYPKFAILNPEYTFSVPREQMVAGIYDIFNHICEQYFSGEDNNTSDYISEGLMRSVVDNSITAMENPKDYEARSNIMWASTWALNSLLAKGKTEDWMVHRLGQAIAAYTHSIHGMSLSAVTIPYYKLLMPYGIKKFVRFAKNVWNVDGTGKTDEEIAEKGIEMLREWMMSMGLVMNIVDLGANPEMIEAYADGTRITTGGYHVLSREEVISVFKEAVIQKRS